MITQTVAIFFGWLTAVHLLEAIILPSLQVPTQILSSLSLRERFINIWSSSADTAHYLLIAQNGYELANKTLFPLWPIVLWLFGANPLVAKILAILATLAFLLFFAKLIKNLGFGKDTETIILSLIVFPASFLLLAPMSEPLYMMLTVITFLLAEKRDFTKAAIFAAAASATRSVGLLLTLYLAIKILKNGKATFRKLWWTLLVSPLGFIAYSLYLQLKFGDFAIFYKDQLGWGRSLGLSPIANLFNETYTTFLQIIGPVKPNPINFLHFGLIFFFVFLAYFAFKRLNRALWVYSVLAIIVPLASGTSVAISRYLLSAFPLFIPLGVFLRKHKTIFYFYLIFSILFQSILLIRFLNFEVAD